MYVVTTVCNYGKSIKRQISDYIELDKGAFYHLLIQPQIL